MLRERASSSLATSTIYKIAPVVVAYRGDNMSLHIYFRGVDELPQLEIKEDIVAWFYYITLDGCDYDKRILESIEQGKYLDSKDFLDRYGRTLPVGFLSSGSKCALLVYHNPVAIINGVEMGRNALRELITHCNRGHVVLPAQNFGMSVSMDDSVIDVICKGKHFTSLHEIAEYLMEDAPYEPEVRE